MKNLLLAFGFWFLFSGYMPKTFAQSGGNNTFEFLNLTNPARVSALGGTIVSVKDNDLNLSFQNPAVLDSSLHNHLALNYVDYFADISYGYVAYSRSWRKMGSFSTGIQYVSYGNFIESDIYGEITGQFTAAEYAFNLSYARSLRDSGLFAGATLKTVYSRLYDYTSYGNAFDLGALYVNSKRLYSAGLVIKNIGMQYKKFSSQKEPFPFEIQAGISKKVRYAPFRLNFTFTHLERWDLTFTDPMQITTDPITGEVIEKSKLNKFGDKLARHFIFGGEVLISKNFHLRAGYNYQRKQELKLEARPGIAGFSFGFGMKIYKFQLSYGYAKYHAAGGPNHFTITSNLSEFYRKK